MLHSFKTVYIYHLHLELATYVHVTLHSDGYCNTVSTHMRICMVKLTGNITLTHSLTHSLAHSLCLQENILGHASTTRE